MYSNAASIPDEYLYKEENGPGTGQQDNWESLQLEKTGENPLICATCKKRKVYIYTKLKSKHKNKTIIFKRAISTNSKPRADKAA